MNKDLDIKLFIEEIIKNLSLEQINFYNNIVTELNSKNHPFEDKELYEIFDKLDTEEKNSIEFKHVINLLCVLRSEVNSYFIDKILKELSKDKRDEISRDDFVIRMKIGNYNSDYNNEFLEIEEIFKIIDTDHDGFIGWQDINTVMNSLGEDSFDDNNSKSLIQIITKQFNKNEEDNEGITLEQFIELFKNEK